MPRWLRWLGLAVGTSAVVVVGVVVGDRAPRLPHDGDHAVGQDEAICLSCHRVTSTHPRPADHPRRDDCFSCHPDSGGALHPRRGAATSLPDGWADDPRL